MEFKDWRKTDEHPEAKSQQEKVRKYTGKRFEDYVGEQIREAMERGEFDNLPGAGKPLHLDSDPYAGDKSLAYHILKSQGYAPKEIELAKEIRAEYERAEAKITRVRRQGSQLRARRVPPFASEKRAYNTSVEKAATSYEQTLRDLNRKILPLNLSTPPALHRSPFDVDRLVREFRESCPTL